MFDYLVLLMQVSYLIILFTYIPFSILLRFIATIKNKKPLWKRLLIIFDLTSFSYYYLAKEESSFRKLYNIFIIIYTVFSLLAFGFGLHMDISL